MHFVTAFFLTFSVLFSTFLHAQQKGAPSLSELDRLEQKLAFARNPNERKRILWQLYDVSFEANLTHAVGYLEEIKELSTSAKDFPQLIRSLEKLRERFLENGDVRAAVSAEMDRLAFLEKTTDSTETVLAELFLAEKFKALNQDDQALKYYFKVLEREELPILLEEKDRIFNQLGLMFRKQRDFRQASEYFLWAEREAKITNDSIEWAHAVNNQGSVYYFKGVYPQAFNLFTKAMDLRNELDDSLGIAQSTNNVALVYKRVGRHEQALREFQKSYQLLRSLKAESFYSAIMDNLGDVYLKLGKLDSALFYHQKAYALAGERKQLFDQIEAAESLIDSYEQLGHHQKALEIARKAISLKDSLYDRNYSRLTTEMQTRYDMERKNAEIEILKSLKEVSELQLDQRTSFLIFGLAIAVITLILLVVLYSQAKSSRETNAQLQEQNQKITQQNIEIEQQSEALNLYNSQIKSSISYAQRIQQANLPSIDNLQKVFSDSFVYFNPLEAVSGDFFWLKKVESKVIVAAADCTGHGVPGAFMSLISNYILQDIIISWNILKPDEILSTLHKGIVSSLDQKNSQNDDGMDIALCVIDVEEQVLYYSGAKNPLTYIHQEQLYNIKGERQSIGGMENRDNFHYPVHSIPYDESSLFYMYSDGFADQFGGGKDKKFGYKRLRNTLWAIRNYPFSDQKKHLAETFSQWQGGQEQIDDVLLIGFRPSSFSSGQLLSR